MYFQRLGRRQFGLKEDPAVPAKKPVTPTAASVASAVMPAGPPGDSLSSIEIIRRTLQSRRRCILQIMHCTANYCMLMRPMLQR